MQDGAAALLAGQGVFASAAKIDSSGFIGDPSDVLLAKRFLAMVAASKAFMAGDMIAAYLSAAAAHQFLGAVSTVVKAIWDDFRAINGAILGKGDGFAFHDFNYGVAIGIGSLPEKGFPAKRFSVGIEEFFKITHNRFLPPWFGENCSVQIS